MAKDDKFLGSKAIPAAGDFIKDFASKPVNLVKGLVNGGGKVGGAVGRTAGNVAQKTDSLIAGTLRNPVTKTALMVVAAVAIYKGVKGFFSRKNKQQEINEISRQADAVEAQNAQMVQDYRGKAQAYQFDNAHAQGGHLHRYQQNAPTQGAAQQR